MISGSMLTAANHAIIYDRSWNSAIDLKVVESVREIYQRDNAQVYYLVTCGTVEEKMYANNHGR